jgi:hypothetical protein
MFGCIAILVYVIATAAMQRSRKKDELNMTAMHTFSQKIVKSQVENAPIFSSEEERQKQLAISVKTKLDMAEKEAFERKEMHLKEIREKSEQLQNDMNRSIEAANQQAKIVERDKLLRKKCASFAKLPRTIRTYLGDGVLEVTCPLNTLYMITGLYDNDEKYQYSITDDGIPSYSSGGSQLQLSISYHVGGKILYPTDGWLNVNGIAEKVTFNLSDSKVLKDRTSEGIFSPKMPGECVITVSVADTYVKLHIIVVPLDIGGNEPINRVISRYGLPDDDLFVVANWPKSKTVHEIYYYQSLKVESRSIGRHWKYDRFPGAVVVVSGKKVHTVSSTTLDYIWPKDEERQFQNRLMGR